MAKNPNNVVESEISRELSENYEQAYENAKKLTH